MPEEATIYALSSGRLPAGVAVIRVSGPGVRFGLDTMIDSMPEPRRLVLRSLRSKQGEVLDRGLVVFFPGAASYVGEDTVELHLHGGRAVVAAVLADLGGRPGFRLAEPGEFTRRALQNGKLDLVQVEGLADLIMAETEGQRRLALRQADGVSSQRLEAWRQQLVRARAYLEAEIDFPDEDDVPGSVSDQIWDELAALRQEFINHVADRSGERMRDGVEIVVVGAANAGKSSLVNALARREVSIVTDIAGTTRDLVEVRLDLDGVPVTLVDTAGLRARVADPIEREGARRALARARQADLTLRLVDVTEKVAPSGADNGGVEADLVVGTKRDLLDSASQRVAELAGFDEMISVTTGAGMESLIARLSAHAGELAGRAGDAVVTRQRHRDALRAAADAMGSALDAVSAPLEVRAEMLRLAADALGRVTGATQVDELLDVVFRDFCMGK